MQRMHMEQRFAKTDQLLEEIGACEAIIDPLLGIEPKRPSRPPAAPPSPLDFSLPAGGDIEQCEEELAKEVASHIKRERQRLGWRQKDLSLATGIARPNIARLESGRRMPKLSTLHKIGQALGIPVEILLGNR